MFGAAARATLDHFHHSNETPRSLLAQALERGFGKLRWVEQGETVSYTTTRSKATLHFADGSTRRVFAKTPSRSLKMRLLVEAAGLSASEVRFYRELAGQVPLRTPRCFYNRHDGVNFELVLEDLSESHGLRSGESACTLNEAEAVIDALARLHAFGWEAEWLNGRSAWLAQQTERELKLGAWLGAPLMRSGLAAAGSLLSPTLRRCAMNYASHRKEADEHLLKPPLTLIHNDCHPGNLAFSVQGAAVFFDWQMVRAGQWARDVSYFCAFSLTETDRRKHERSLLERYLKRLKSIGHCLKPERAWLAYRRHAVYALEAAVITLGLGASEDAAARTWLRRAASAVEDLDSFAALGLSD